MKDEEVSSLFRKREERTKKLEIFLSQNKRKWFTTKELAQKLTMTESEVIDTFFHLQWKPLSWLFRRYAKEDFGSIRVCRRVW